MVKRKSLLVELTFCVIISSFNPLFSQEDTDSKFSAGADFYSNYIWRGSKYGTGPAIQPSVKYSGNIFTAGAWGSIDFNGYQEADLYFSFSLPAGINLGMTDYYYPGLKYFDYSDTTGSHVYEINASFSKGNFLFNANYSLNEAGGAGSLGDDLYFQANYAFKHFNIFIGAGDGWHTYDSVTDEDKFAICNLGIGTIKTIKVTDTFSVPLTGQVIFNPDKEQLFIVVGFTF